MSEKDTTLPKRELIEEYLSHYSDVFSESTLFYLKNYYRFEKIIEIVDQEEEGSQEEYERCIQEGIFTKEEADKISDTNNRIYDEVKALLSGLLGDLSKNSDWSYIKFKNFRTSKFWGQQYCYLTLEKEGKEIELQLYVEVDGASKPGEQPTFWSILFLKEGDKSLLEKIKLLYRSKDAGYRDPVDVWKDKDADVKFRIVDMSVPLEKGVSYKNIEDELYGFLNNLQAMAEDILNLKN